MTKKNLWLFAVLVVAAAAYVFFFTSWFKPRKIRIFYTTQPFRRYERFEQRHREPFVLFGLFGKYQLTEIKVVPLADFQANPDALPVWHLVSDSNSVPVSQFIYGEHIHGMKAAVKGERPEELQTNVVYRLFVSAGSLKGWHDFEIK